MKSILSSLFVSLSFASLALISAGVDWWQPTWSLEKITATFTILSITHAVFRVFFYYLLFSHITAGKIKYSLHKILTLVHLLIASLFILRVWLPDSNALLAAYGFIGAAVAFAVQDLVKNLLGGMVILVRSPYKAGDRIQIDEMYGDVIDVGLLYTTLLEIRGWVAGDQSTGRIVRVANSKVLSRDVANYTADHSFIWEEIHIPITHESDWKKAESIITNILDEVTQQLSTTAMMEINHLRSKYFLRNDDIDSHVYLKITDNWTSLYARYIVDVRERRPVHNFVMREVKTQFDKEKRIEIASNTSTVTVREHE